ncbi:MAG: hypothetical protein R3290_08015 [Acidimicrobiia bacterium]|nr:hypothetical protein [Acidimicrobiia bacterium]
MYWLGPSPLPRRVAAVLLVVAALAWDLRSRATVDYPFAAADTARGEPVAVEWRPVPAGILPEPAGTGVAAVEVRAGTPLTASVLTATPIPPDEWWAVPVDAAAHAAAGDTVLLVSADPPLEVTGLVTAAQEGDRFGTAYRAALVAVPGAQAPLVAAAAARGSLLVAVRPGVDGGR